ncbi:MAG: CpaF family protein [Negativicutes bacterium]|nr:CpaF family protein [Negativicutes bacterium]
MEQQSLPPEQYDAIKGRIHQRLVREMRSGDYRIAAGVRTDESHPLMGIVVRLSHEVIDSDRLPVSAADRARLVAETIDEILGLGPIEPLLKQEDVSEVMVNGPKSVYVEKAGKIIATGIEFRDAAHVMHVIERIVAPLGRRIDESSPLVDARLPDGSRVNAIIPPLALNGPCLTIRKFARNSLGVEELVELGTLSVAMADFLKTCVRGKLNLVVAGGSGSGKTTTLNALSAFIPDDERIITIEDAAELKLKQGHVVRLETRLANIEGKGTIDMRELVRNALRMRPDRIVVGEVRGGETLDMLQAMNTGHNGSMTTVHANSPRDMLSRLETMALMAGLDIPMRAIRDQIASAINLIIYQSRQADGSRRITQITEIQGIADGEFVLHDVFAMGPNNKDGKAQSAFYSTEGYPKCVEKIRIKGA